MAHFDVIAALARQHPRIRLEPPEGLGCGLGWVALVDEVLGDIEHHLTEEQAGTVLIRGIDVHRGQLEIEATWDLFDDRLEILDEMLTAAWRRSWHICQHCGRRGERGRCGVCVA